MNKYCLYLILPVIFCCACNQNSNIKPLTAINNSLLRANRLIEKSNKSICDELVEKLHDPRTEAKASIWQPKAQRIQQLSNNARSYIKVLKVQPGKEAATVGGQLFDTLIALKSQLLTVFNPGEFEDWPLTKEDVKKSKQHFVYAMPVLPRLHPDSSASVYKQNWLDSNFYSNTPQMLSTMLSKIENDILVSENMLMEYCNSHLGVTDGNGMYSAFSAITTLSSSYVKVGQPIEVTAGIGDFSDASLPQIFINGNRMALNTDPFAKYKFIAGGKPGAHVVDVKIVFIRGDGVKMSLNRKLEYIVAE